MLPSIKSLRLQTWKVVLGTTELTFGKLGIYFSGKILFVRVNSCRHPVYCSPKIMSENAVHDLKKNKPEKATGNMNKDIKLVFNGKILRLLYPTHAVVKSSSFRLM